VLKNLEIIPVDKIPFLIPSNGIRANKKNAFKYAVNNNKRVCVKQFISIMTMCDPKGLVYQKYVDKNLTVLLENNIDIRSYFCSSMPIHKIPYNRFYEQYSETDKTFMIPCSAKNIRDIERNFYRYIEPAMLEDDSFFSCCDCRGRKMQRIKDEHKCDEDVLLYRVANHLVKEANAEQGEGENDELVESKTKELHEIEYLVINLKEVFTNKDRKKFMQ
jgi:hypothetical protein